MSGSSERLVIFAVFWLLFFLMWELPPEIDGYRAYKGHKTVHEDNHSGRNYFKKFDSDSEGNSEELAKLPKLPELPALD